MVHVTFNEKVECHQYSSSPTQTNSQSSKMNDSRNSVDEVTSGQSDRKYTAEFMKGLKSVALSQVCPDVVKKAMADGKRWTKNGRKSVFYRPQQQQNSTMMRRPEPYFPNNQANYGGLSRDEMQPIEPVGSSRYTSHYRNYQNRNYMQDHSNNFAYGSNLLPDFAQNRFCHRTSETKISNEDGDEPEWYRGGPTSPNDCIELHGFDGPGNHENHDNHNRNDQFGCVDGNTSGGPTSGASSNNGSPPAKSTPAKVSFSVSNDAQRNRRYDVGRHTNWQNSLDNRQHIGTPLLNELFKNYSKVQNQSNLRGLTPLVSVQDLESALVYEKLKFQQMLVHSQIPDLNRNHLYHIREPIPHATQVLAEVDKILQTSNDSVYKRREVRELTKNILESVIRPISLMNLLKNPLMESQNRETIQAALKIIAQAKENATKAMKMHKPTESELRLHMDAIMQDAILKKRIETYNELLKSQNPQSEKIYQTFHQMFRPNAAGRFENRAQGDSRGQYQSFENGSTLSQENYLNRWFSQSLLNKGPGGLPQIPSESLRSEELEKKIKHALMCNEKDIK